jgi:hypothetical protein
VAARKDREVTGYQVWTWRPLPSTVACHTKVRQRSPFENITFEELHPGIRRFATGCAEAFRGERAARLRARFRRGS